MDNGFVEREEGTPTEVAAGIEKPVTVDERQQWQGGTSEQWALESLPSLGYRCIASLHLGRS